MMSVHTIGKTPHRPLSGTRILEFAGAGPAPFAAMMMADHGAEVVRIERENALPLCPTEKDVLLRNRTQIIQLDLRSETDLERARFLAAEAHGLIEGFRPGVMEKLGLGPKDLAGRNPKLVYGRMTGFGQNGPLSAKAGHDINYIALAGNLHGYGRREGRPTPPGNAVADMGGGGMMLAFAMVSGILAARETGRGTVIDCAMVDGAALLGSQVWSFFASGDWRDERGANLLDSGAAYYDTYLCADGKWLAIGAIEPKFFERLRQSLGLRCTQDDPELRGELEQVLQQRSRDEWLSFLQYDDVCVTPVLSLSEAPAHAHNFQRGTFLDDRGFVEPAPAPRFSALNE